MQTKARLQGKPESLSFSSGFRKTIKSSLNLIETLMYPLEFDAVKSESRPQRNLQLVGAITESKEVKVWQGQ